MINWIKNILGINTNEKITISENESKINSNELKNQEHVSQDIVYEIGADLGSITLANVILHNMPFNFFPQLKNAQININENVVSILINEDVILIDCMEMSLNLKNEVFVGTYYISTSLNKGKEIIEQIQELGQDSITLYSNASFTYINGFLHGYLAAILGMFDEGLSLKNEKEEEWHVSLGNFLLQGKIAEKEMDENHLYKIIECKLVNFQLNMKDEIYGLKIYMAQINGNQFYGDCHLDNEIWEEGIEALKENDYPNWMPSNTLNSKKQWIFFKKCKK
jgi:hypothetical protein